jgi:hypothetical protein
MGFRWNKAAVAAVSAAAVSVLGAVLPETVSKEVVASIGTILAFVLTYAVPNAE